MAEEYEIMIKSDSLNLKRDGRRQENPFASLLLSWLPSSDDFESNNNTNDEVLKPLYYIVGDINSEQMEATVESTDDESIAKNETTDKPLKQKRRQPRRTNFLRNRFLEGVMNRFKKWKDLESTPLR